MILQKSKNNDNNDVTEMIYLNITEKFKNRPSINVDLFEEKSTRKRKNQEDYCKNKEAKNPKILCLDITNDSNDDIEMRPHQPKIGNCSLTNSRHESQATPLSININHNTNSHIFININTVTSPPRYKWSWYNNYFAKFHNLY